LKKDLFFQINPVSGWIFFEMQNQLWSTFQKGVLPTVEDARKVADDFVKKLVKESMTEEFKSKKIPPILPNSIYAKIIHRSTKQVPHYELSLVDHWAITYSVALKRNTADTNFYELEGSTITIRIGFKNNIIGFSSQWRPSFLTSYEEDLIHSHEEDEKQDKYSKINEHGNHADDEKTELVYELAGESEFQNKIVPYYKSAVSHHANYEPASPTAFVISLTESFNYKDNKEIWLQITGGSGDFVYSIYAFKPDEVFEEGYFVIQNGKYEEGKTKIDLDKAVYNLIVWVADVNTGFIKKYEQNIYSFPIMEVESSLNV
jgi:hypothetical protein